MVALAFGKKCRPAPKGSALPDASDAVGDRDGLHVGRGRSEDAEVAGKRVRSLRGPGAGCRAARTRGDVGDRRRCGQHVAERDAATGVVDARGRVHRVGVDAADDRRVRRVLRVRLGLLVVPAELGVGGGVGRVGRRGRAAPRLAARISAPSGRDGQTSPPESPGDSCANDVRDARSWLTPSPSPQRCTGRGVGRGWSAARRRLVAGDRVARRARTCRGWQRPRSRRARRRAGGRALRTTWCSSGARQRRPTCWGTDSQPGRSGRARRRPG